jgi:chromosome segregation ATPase
VSKLHRFLLLAVLAAAGTLLVVPMAAQSDVAPDHFLGASADQPAQPALTKLSNQIAARRQELEGYYQALHRQLGAVEEARELAAGSGAMGDAAGMYIEAYRKELRTLEALTLQLNARIRVAQAAIGALENQLARTAHAVSAGHGSHGT